MFDANLKYIPKGRRVFVEVLGLGESSKLAELGVKVNDLVLCTMLDDSHEACSIRIILPKGKSLKIRSDEDFYDLWLIYAGNGDAKEGFLNEKQRLRAQRVLENL